MRAVPHSFANQRQWIWACFSLFVQSVAEQGVEQEAGLRVAKPVAAAAAASEAGRPQQQGLAVTVCVTPPAPRVPHPQYRVSTFYTYLKQSSI